MADAKLPSFTSTGDGKDEVEKFATHTNYTWEGLNKDVLKSITVNNEVENGRHSMSFDAQTNRVTVSQSGMPLDLLAHLTRELVIAANEAKKSQ